MGYYLHEIPGRMRIKIPALRRNSDEAVEIQGLLEDLNGITSTFVNTITGSIVVRYDPEIVTSGAILDFFAREGYIDVGEAISGKHYTRGTLPSVGQAASKALIGLALDRLLQGSPLSILTALI
ncbi:MAG TPA: hypothetical protein VMC85_16975 [Desulfomonilaceae bacterium]|nr:hypothetical protein [Desulfomonilaceae bacterium]